MAKFTTVRSIPEQVGKNEVVIVQPDFLEQIQENARKAPRVKQTALNHMREILQSISNKYDPDMNVFKFKLANYEGLPYANDQELSAIILKILKTEYPAIFDKYLETKIKERPFGTKLVWYVGDFNNTSPFYKSGLDYIEEKDVEAYLTGKPKKVVGKPAVSKEEVESNDE